MPDRDLTQVESVFHAVLELPPNDREEFLEQACNGDKSLYAEVSSLISAFDSRGGFIEEPALNLGFQVLSKSSEQSMTGKSIGPYNVISRLGKGGMGEVYLAEDTKLGRKVALKFLTQEFVGDNWAKRQLLKEAQAAAMLDHPNICTVHGIEESDEHTFIVMQYIEGETLSEFLKRDPLLPTIAIEFARQIVGALAEAHSHGIIHRDMKPKNIMVTPGRQIKVLDFGLAKTMRHAKGATLTDDSVSQLSRNGLFAGTVAYMSPEQLRGDRLDYRTDIFSLGTVLYEMIIGNNPFGRGSQAETISAILSSTPKPPSGNTSDAIKLARIALKCLEKDRENRYHSASELLIEIEDSSKSKELPKRKMLPKLGLIAALVVIGVLILVYSDLLRFTKRLSGPATTTDKPSETRAKFSIAILPITYGDGNKADDYITQGLTTGLINRFSSISELRVIPHTSVAGYVNKTSDPRQAGRELKVDAVLTGQLTQRGVDFELHSTLIKIADGSQIWSGKQDLAWATIFNVQDNLVNRVAEGLQIRFETKSKPPGTNNPEAYKLYMRGRYYWNNRTKENIERAIVAFNAAIEMDPAFPHAWAGLANSYVLQSSVGFGKTRTEEAMTRALAAAKEAIALDDNLAEAHTSLGIVELRYRWDWNKAEKEFTRAIEIDPDFAPAHYWYSHLLLIKGQPEAAIAESGISRSLDPSPHSIMNSCRVLSLSRQYEQAIGCYDKLIAEKPDYSHAIYLRAWVFLRSGRNAEALQVFQDHYAKDRAFAGAALGYVYGEAGRTSDARRILKEMESLGKEQYLPPMEFAIIHVGLGDKDKAFEWLERAYQERFAHLPYITLDPIYASLHSDPRYASLLQRLNLTPPKPM